MEEAFQDKQRKQEDERKRIEVDRRAHEERERQRKAKLGTAFVFGADDDEDDGRSQMPAGGTMVRRSAQDRVAAQELGYSDMHAHAGPRSMALALPGGGQDPRFVEAMGGDKLLAEAHAILKSAAGTGRLGASSPRRSRTRSRSRKRGRSPKRLDMRSTGSYRSPTPDGRARGQARAARKAKMIASLMGLR